MQLHRSAVCHRLQKGSAAGFLRRLLFRRERQLSAYGAVARDAADFPVRGSQINLPRTGLGGRRAQPSKNIVAPEVHPRVPVSGRARMQEFGENFDRLNQTPLAAAKISRNQCPPDIGKSIHSTITTRVDKRPDTFALTCPVRCFMCLTSA